MLHDIKITSPHGIGAGSHVEIDGETNNHISVVKFEVTADNFVIVEITALAQKFEFDGKAAVTIDTQTAALLKSLGWTPPNG